MSKVWPYLADFRSTEQWDPPTVTTTRTSGDGGVDTTYLNVGERGTHGGRYHVDVRCEENSVLELEGDAGSVKLRDTITFASTVDGGTEVRYHAEFKPSGVGEAGGAIAAGATQDPGGPDWRRAWPRDWKSSRPTSLDD